FKKRVKMELQDEKADQEIVQEVRSQWEELEAAADGYDFRMALALSISDAEANPRKRGSSSEILTASSKKVASFGSTTVKEKDAWDQLNVEYHQHKKSTQNLKKALVEAQEQNKDSQSQLKALNHQVKKAEDDLKSANIKLQKLQEAQQSFGPVRTDKYKRQNGKRLSEDEIRAIQHTYEVCRIEQEQGKAVLTSNPFLRTSHYLGIAERAARDVVGGKYKEDRRGRYTRYDSARLFASDLRQMAAEMNLNGNAVTLNRLPKRVKNIWPEGYTIPGRETIRKIMCKIGFVYEDSEKTKNFIDTLDIKRKRQYYLKERYSDKFKDALFVWLDESYCNQQHVAKKHCQDSGYPKVVFCMDNAKYHRRERRVPDKPQNPSDGQSKSKTLSQLNSPELIERLVKLGNDKSYLDKLNKADLYQMAKLPENQVPLAVEDIHPDLNPIEEAWRIVKNFISFENDGKSFLKVKDLIFEGFKIADPSWAKLVARTRHSEMKYIKKER
ncbi:hypothetical protein BGX27_001960, partial [Mortierella sp. AM989]